MPSPLIFLSIPGLREQDVVVMPNLQELMQDGRTAALAASFPAVTWPVQANMLTGELPAAHGVISNGFYWRQTEQVEMWTAGNDKIERPQVWDIMRSSGVTTAVWFPMLSKGCGADYICMPAPVHNPDGSESMWCYTRPKELYGELLATLGHFPLQHFWGPLAGIASTDWIVDSAVMAAIKYRPDFFMLYLPHLDYAAQKLGPDSDAARRAVVELDQTLGRLAAGMREAYDGHQQQYPDGSPLRWLVASEYVITPVDHVSYPNRELRDWGMLQVATRDGREYLDFNASQAWSLVDHQLSHVFCSDSDASVIERVVAGFSGREGIAEVLAGADRGKYAMDHPRSGDVILISQPNSWQAYYWWHDDALAPEFATTVDIHRKPGYDPVELHFDPATRGIPLDATLIKGSHGAPVASSAQTGVVLSSDPQLLPPSPAQVRDVDIAGIIVRACTTLISE
ncbi:MAG: alkaline phosphatase family protein [Planctomycetales bacterium]|nr:alkaline phosphatase family protein [Planctomycetales bacterium]